MKNKILIFIIGVLVGAIIATAGFLIYNKITKNNFNQTEMMQMNGNGQMGGIEPGNMEEPLEKPDGYNGEEPPTKPTEDNGEEVPEKPDDSNNNTNS